MNVQNNNVIFLITMNTLKILIALEKNAGFIGNAGKALFKAKEIKPELNAGQKFVKGVGRHAKDLSQTAAAVGTVGAVGLGAGVVATKPSLDMSRISQ